MISIILPVYNQRQNLPIIVYLLDQMSKKNSLNIQIIIVQDNSPDKTLQVAKQLIKIFQNIRILERPGKMGLGSAYKDGLKLCKGQFVIIMDADFSHHPKYIPMMVEKQKKFNADIVTSSRYTQNGGVQGWNFKRKLTSRVANFLASWTLGSTFSDLTGSYRLYKKQVLEQLITQTKTKGYSFQMQILIRAWKSNKIIIQQPIVFVDRIYGKSKLQPGQIFIYIQGMIKLFFTY